MKQVFDLIDAIEDKIMTFLEQEGRTPREVSISREAYRRLVEIKTDEGKIGNLVIGCSAIAEITTSVGKIALLIDELLSETDVEVS